MVLNNKEKLSDQNFNKFNFSRGTKIFTSEKFTSMNESISCVQLDYNGSMTVLLEMVRSYQQISLYPRSLNEDWNITRLTPGH